MARELTTAARAAKTIRTNLRKQGLACKVTSSNFSMGDSVSVTIVDQRPEVRKLVERYCGHFQYGHFDGMTDCYEYSNKRNDVPQAKFVSVSNTLSDELRERIYESLRTDWAGGDELPETYDEGRTRQFHGQWIDQFVYRQFAQEDSVFWRAAEAKRRAA